MILRSNGCTEDVSHLAEFARELALAARQISLQPFTGEIRDKAKNGTFDPVTARDVAVEQQLRAMVEARFPNHAIAGEEGGNSGQNDARIQWSLDPIDGTRSYVSGLPTWTTLIAMLDGGDPVLGLIDAPRLDELYLGHGSEAVVVRGGQVTTLATSECRSVAGARLSTTDPFLFSQADADAFDRVRKMAKITRFGLDGYAYGRLAAGTLDLVIESGLKAHDWNALVPIVRASGGSIGNWNGGTDLSAGAIIAASTPDLYDEAVRLLAG